MSFISYEIFISHFTSFVCLLALSDFFSYSRHESFSVAGTANNFPQTVVYLHSPFILYVIVLLLLLRVESVNSFPF